MKDENSKNEENKKMGKLIVYSGKKQVTGDDKNQQKKGIARQAVCYGGEKEKTKMNTSCSY